MRRAGLGRNAAEIAHIGAAIGASVAVKRLAPETLVGQAQAIVQPRLGREIAYDRDRRVALGAAPEKREHRLHVVVDDDPAKAVGLAIAHMERGRLAIKPVEIADQRLHALMRPMLEQPPGERLRGVPLARLPELLAHEQELLARVPPHEAVERAGVGEALPFVARHFADDRAFAVHDLVVRDRQHEVLAEGIKKTEGHLVVAPAAVDRVARNVVERVVHPAHVPLEAEAETAVVGRPRDAGKCGRFLGDGHCARKAAVDELVGAAQEGDRLAVLPAAVGVRQPFALAARIVEVEHRGDGVDTQPVDVEAVDPVEGVAVEEIGDFVAAEIVDRGVPVRMEALAGIGMFVKRGAVEPRQAMLVGGEMRRRPVKNHAEAGGVRAVDEAREARRFAESAGRRKKTDRLVAPGLVERMLADRQKLEMGVTHPRGVRDQLVGEFVIGEKPSVLPAPPRPEMNLVDRHRLAARFALAAPGHIRGVGPGKIGAVGHHRGGRGPELGLEAERIGLERQQARRRGPRARTCRPLRPSD